jgi:alcohol dehydrogenase class IV
MKRDLDHEEAAWVEQRQVWLAIALNRAQNARARLGRIHPVRCTLQERTEANLAATEAANALARALQIRQELRDAGYETEPWLEEVYQRIKGE